ncbi:MAG: transcriptional repressor [Magnetococcales bacterium]|nr:transcriptional repressor [Magnetococcales bacterium]
MQRARQLCKTRGLRLTKQRLQVLDVLANSHKALGAYEIRDILEQQDIHLAPISVYRQLDFLLENNLIHRIASLNAFMVCSHKDNNHGGQFLICEKCGVVAELIDLDINDVITTCAEKTGFNAKQPIVEVPGLCKYCQ